MRFYFFLIFCICLLAATHSVQAQTCKANMSASTPDSQLTDNVDGTITDSKNRPDVEKMYGRGERQ